MDLCHTLIIITSTCYEWQHKGDSVQSWLSRIIFTNAAIWVAKGLKMKVKATTVERATSLTSDSHALSPQPHPSPTPPPAPRSLCNRALNREFRWSTPCKVILLTNLWLTWKCSHLTRCGKTALDSSAFTVFLTYEALKAMKHFPSSE